LAVESTLVIAGIRSVVTRVPLVSVALKDVLPEGIARLEREGGNVTFEMALLAFFKVSVLPVTETSVKATEIALLTYEERSAVFVEPSASTRLKILPDMDILETAAPKGTGTEPPMCVVKVRVLLDRETPVSHWVLPKAFWIANARSVDIMSLLESLAFKCVLPVGTERLDRAGVEGRVKVELLASDFFKVSVLPERVTSVTACAAVMAAFTKVDT
jgi:hypothetical protein